MGVIIRQSIKGTLANYIGIAVGFVTTFFILTHYLTAEEVGLTRVLVDAAILFSTLAQLGTNSSILRYYPYFKDEEKSNHGLFFWSLILPFIGFLLFLVCFFIFREKLIDVFQEKSALLVNYFYFIIPIAFFLLYIESCGCPKIYSRSFYSLWIIGRVSSFWVSNHYIGWIGGCVLCRLRIRSSPQSYLSVINTTHLIQT